MIDPYENEDYQEYLEKMSEECVCQGGGPCDGVLAGGFCDKQVNSEDLNEDLYEEDIPW